MNRELRKKMLLKNGATDQKLRGGYYTPEPLADSIVKLFVDDVNKGNIQSVLEPSAGDGIFIKSIQNYLNLDKIGNITAVELLEEEAEKIKKITYNDDTFNVMNRDFMEFYDQVALKEKFDLIIGNPPYIRYQYLTEEQRLLQAKVLQENGMKPNKLINAWVYFLVAAVSLLNENGKIAFVIPAVFLQLAYAQDFRLFLTNTLSKITIIAFEELLFEGVEQEVVVFIGEKEVGNNTADAMIGMVEYKNLLDVGNLDLKGIEYQLVEHSKEKWTKYFISKIDTDLIRDLKEHSKFVNFNDIGLVNVGITTGNNSYFSVNEEIVEKYDLQNVVLPLIGRSSHAHGIYFTDEDWKKNVDAQKNSFLIKFPDDMTYEEYPDSHKKYIELGESNGENLGYKCRIRDRWYIVPSVWVPDAFFLRRNNIFPKFVINNIDAVSTDTMHRIKFYDGIDKDKALLSYYNSITFAFTEINGRSYGGGVLEILPGEVGKIILPNLQAMDETKVKYLLDQIDKTIRNDLSIEDLLDEIDREVLVGYLGIAPAITERFRNIWKLLMTRRHNRSK